LEDHMRTREYVAVALGALMISSPVLAGKVERIALRFSPKENVTANVPTIEISSPTPIEIAPLKDVRSLPDLLQVGENREDGKPTPVHAKTSVAEFATSVLAKCLPQWGVRVEGGGLILKGEITNLFVTEDKTYSTQVNMRFQLQDQAGKAIWQGIVSGDAHQWGRSLSEENYNEQISDALKRTYANVVSSAVFQKAWTTGKAPAAAEPASTPQAMKAAILKMLGQGIGAETVVEYVRGARIEPALTPDDMLDWKASGVPEAVLKAAVTR
jgi:hypothetical protein